MFVILMIDAMEGIESQDINIFNLIEKNRKGVVILVNKWDLVEKDQKTSKAFEDKIKEKIAPFVDVPIIFTSAINKQRIFKAIETANEVYINKTIIWLLINNKIYKIYKSKNKNNNSPSIS